MPLYYIDPNPIKIPNLRNPLEIIPVFATEGVPLLAKNY
jgi:NAD-dependent deacetylase